MRWLLLISLLLAFPAFAQDQTVQPDADNTNPTDVFTDTCSTACNAADCSANVDELISASDNVHVKSITNNATITFDLETPTSNPSTVADDQTFRIEVSRCDDDAGSCPVRASAGSDPDYDIAVLCNGTLLGAAEIATAVVVTGSDQVDAHTWTFNTTDCAADGSDVEVRIDFGQSGGSPGNRNWPCIDSIDWEVTYAAAASRNRIIVVD